MSNNEIREIYESLKNLKALIDVMSWIASRFDKAVDQLEGYASIDDVLREQSEFLVNTTDRFYRMFLLILKRLPPLTNDGSISSSEFKRLTRETAQLEQEAIDERVRSLRIQINTLQKRINSLEEEIALHGPDFSKTQLVISNREAKEDKERELRDLLRVK